MRFDGADRKEQACCDLRIAEPFYDQLQYFVLPAGEMQLLQLLFIDGKCCRRGHEYFPLNDHRSHPEAGKLGSYPYTEYGEENGYQPDIYVQRVIDDQESPLQPFQQEHQRCEQDPV